MPPTSYRDLPGALWNHVVKVLRDQSQRQTAPTAVLFSPGLRDLASDRPAIFSAFEVPLLPGLIGPLAPGRPVVKAN